MESSRQSWYRIIEIAVIALPLASFSYFFWDQTFAQWGAKPENGELWLWARRITVAGAGDPYFLIATCLVILGRWTPKIFQWSKGVSQKIFVTGVNTLASLASAGLVTHLIKYLVGRQRPHMSAPEFIPRIFHPLSWHWHWNSFPSGHSETLAVVYICLLSAFPRLEWPHRVVVGFLLFVLAFTRALIQAHFLSDVFAGWFIGVLVAVLTLNVLNRFVWRKPSKNL